MNVKEFLHLKGELEEKRSSLARLQGKRESLLQRLADEFDCKSVPEAKKLLAKKEKQLENLERDYEEEKRRFDKDYGAKLAS